LMTSKVNAVNSFASFIIVFFRVSVINGLALSDEAFNHESIPGPSSVATRPAKTWK